MKIPFLNSIFQNLKSNYLLYFLILIILSAYTNYTLFHNGTPRPLFSIYFSFISPDFFNLYEILSYILLILLFLKYFSNKTFGFQEKVKKTLSSKAAIFLLLYSGWVILITFAFKLLFNNYTTHGDAMKLIPNIIVFFAIIILVKDRKDLKAIFTAWIIIGVANLGMAFSQIIFQGPYLLNLHEIVFEKLAGMAVILRRESLPIVVGFFNHQNRLARFLAPYVVVTFSMWFFSSKILSRKSLLWLLLSGLFAFILLMTFTRGPILFSILGIFVSFVMIRKRNYFNIKFFIISLLTIIILINIIGIFIIGKASHLEGRLSYIFAAKNLLGEKKLELFFGSGIRFWDKYLKENAWWTMGFWNAHNIYVDQVLYHGLVGLTLWFLFIFNILKKVFSKTGHPDHYGLMSIYPYLGALWAILGSYFFAPTEGMVTQKFHSFFILAILTVITDKSFIKNNENS